MNILFQGDSITDGMRLKEPERRWDLNNQIGHSYVYMIAGYLGYTRATAGLHFINRGISGESISDIYERRKTDIFSENPDIFSLLVGINESWRINDGDNIPVHMKKFEKLYRMLLEELREQRPDTGVVICEPFVFETERNKVEYKKEFSVVKEISEMLPGITRDYNAVYVTLWNEMRSLCAETGNTCWTWDGIHPTEAGHHFIALKWLEKVSLSGLLEREYGS